MQKSRWRRLAGGGSVFICDLKGVRKFDTIDNLQQPSPPGAGTIKVSLDGQRPSSLNSERLIHGSISSPGKAVSEQIRLRRAKLVRSRVRAANSRPGAIGNLIPLDLVSSEMTWNFHA